MPKPTSIPVVFDEAAGKYRVLRSPGGKQPGVEVAHPLVVEVASEWYHDLKKLRKARGGDFVRNAAAKDPRTVAVVAGVFVGGALLWEVGAMIAKGLAGLDPASVFTADHNLGGLSLAELNLLVPSGGGSSSSSSNPSSLLPQYPTLPFPLEPVV